MRDIQLNHVALATAALLAAVLAGCAGAPQPDTPPVRQQTQVQTAGPDTQAVLLLPASAFSAEFAAAEQALSHSDWMGAAVALQSLPDDQLTADDQAYLGYLQARMAWLRGEQSLALNTLRQLDQADVHPALRYRNLNFQHHILQLQGEHLAGAQLGMRLLQGAPASDREALKRGIWRNLQRLDQADLARAAAAAHEPNYRGWLQLALLSGGDTASLAGELQQWRTDFSDHPAADPLPGGLGYLLQTPAAMDTVALILPLSGRLAAAGKAVRDGYLAHYYTARGNRPGDLLVLDSDSYSSTAAAYTDAALRGAQLVIGPLSKQSVGELAALPQRDVPILALNRIEASATPGSSALVQLALAPEDEAARIAELAFGQGARRALVLRPAGAWGDKVEQALGRRWAALGGSIASSVRYNSREDYSSSMKTGLGLQASESRRRRVRDMLATNVEFTARRREDLDAIFLLARSGTEARSIKPLLAFHYAGELPVYATSSIYSGFPDERDRDLDGIRLVETPWLLGSNPGLRVALAAGGTGSDNYTRLNALGVDAYRLQSRFAQLRGGADTLLPGDTGLLSLNPQLQLLRELPPATFDGGELKPL